DDLQYPSVRGCGCHRCPRRHHTVVRRRCGRGVVTHYRVRVGNRHRCGYPRQQQTHHQHRGTTTKHWASTSLSIVLEYLVCITDHGRIEIQMQHVIAFQPGLEPHVATSCG